MDKGWGLALDSCPSPTLPLFFHPSSSKQPHTTSVKPFTHHDTRMFPLLGFPVKLTRPNNNNNKEEQHDLHAAHHDDDNNHHHRKVVGEVDFFSDRNKRTSPPPPPGHDRDHDHHRHVKPNIISVKKELIPHDNETPPNVNTGLQLLTANTGSDQSTVDDGVSSSDAEDKRAKSTELAMLQVELQRMNAENQRLKEMLSHVSGNYTALQMHLATLMQHQQNHRTESTENEVVQGKGEEKKPDVSGVMAPRQFLDLVAAGTAEVDDQVSNSSSDERTRSGTPQNNNTEVGTRDHVRNNNGKNEMGREESPDSESQGWAANKQQKLNPSNAMDQSTSEATMRKARVSVRARSEAPMISDGCQWRKYGQKMAKGNPCPRAYYRCTMAVGCPVRKQVQRCAEDTAILVTTYEGTHNHPLPPAAMAMASTTTAAASMLLSGSMSSADGIMNPNLLARAILPCSSSMATLSASAPFPTVTLDLTHNPTSTNPLQAQIRPLHHPAPLFQVPNFQGQPQNFGSGSGSGGATNNTATAPFAQALYNQSRFSGLQLSQEAGSSQLALQASRPPVQQNQQQQPSLADTVTAAITTDPNFTAVLAAAISSIIGGGAHPNNNDNNNNNSNTNSNVNNRSTTISSFSGN